MSSPARDSNHYLGIRKISQSSIVDSMNRIDAKGRFVNDGEVEA